MKIILEEREKKLAENINKDLENGENIPLFLPRKNTKYYLEFTCNDIGKANAFANYFMRPDENNISKELGIDITAINYSPGAKIETVKNILTDALRKLEEL